MHALTHVCIPVVLQEVGRGDHDAHTAIVEEEGELGVVHSCVCCDGWISMQGCVLPNLSPSYNMYMRRTVCEPHAACAAGGGLEGLDRRPVLWVFMETIVEI